MTTRVLYRVVGTFPDGSERFLGSFVTLEKAQTKIALLRQGCSPCAKKSYGELKVVEVVVP